MSLFKKLFIRLFKYSIAGGATFTGDLLLLSYITSHTAIPRVLAVGGSFFIAVTINYVLCYHLVYRGTTQQKGRGYLYFMLLAVGAIALIVTATELLVHVFSLPLLVARVIVGICVGFLNFLINTFYNFKIL